ncbi:hypothetical protein HBI56_147650 [Parastagonospora nodorum]|nr:hypothetical protein HBH52_071690 [Parastagonospora nodorum]KAH3995616.1 hypothetical protein HBI10_168480 [Parastagonospora nodorum]KAH4015751.1 hypothetical protein HBI13_158070 [Parastagonospora nodorum]KAH4023820.1 hypothetical protein HBI09_164470 [Parastagonospora nodorum]KAH4125030.1 hypothetical protein HBH47_061090 [Parastagonospora nodorum]
MAALPQHHPQRAQRRCVPDRATRLSEQSDAFGHGRCGYKLPIVPPAFRRSIHRLKLPEVSHTFGAQQHGRLFVPFFHATCSDPSSDRNRQRGRLSGVSLWRVHRSFNSHLKPALGVCSDFPTMHQPADTDREEAPRSPKPANSIFTMEAREGRIGNAFACERCRKHKVRCVPSDTAGLCQRCQKARVECIEHVVRRRPAKTRGDVQPPTRLRDFDKKLDKLSTVMATMAPAPAHSTLPSVTTVPSHIIDAPLRTSPPALVTPVSAPPVHTPILPAPAPASGTENSLPFWDSISETLACLGRLDPVIRTISLGHMQMMLDTYQRMVDFFPFVTLPKDCSCQELVLHRPVLMLAVLTAASYESSSLQLTLSREFRKVAMVKILNGEKSLDLLQGLLIFIAWHHHYMDAQAVSVPMLLQMCVGIASDLGLDRISTSVRSPLHREDPSNREAKRAYLGCYYLASNIGLIESGKSRCMSYSATLRNYASDLASSWEQKTDSVLPIFVDVCQFMEDVEETFQGRCEQALVARSQVKRLSDKWDHIRSASKLQANDYKTLQWIQLAARIHLYKIAAAVDLLDRESAPWASGFQLSLRVTCLRSIEQFLDNSIQLSTAQYEFISLVDWLNLVSGIISLGKLGLHSSPLPGWDPVELQITRTFEYFRDHLSSQMPRQRENQDNNENAFERFRRVTSVMTVALKSALGGGSPNGSTFELATGSGRTVSLLQDLSLPKIKSMGNGTEKLPSLWKINPSLDMNSNEFHWKFLMGTV